jgi:protein TonB
MSHDNFDKDIADLYQQRKQQIQAPKINLSPTNEIKTKRYGVLQMLGILFLGGTASFGILAIISHFSVKAPVSTVIAPGEKMRVVELKNKQVKATEDITTIVIPPLVPLKPYASPAPFKHERAIKNETVHTDLVISLSVDVVNVSAYPALKQPELSMVPVYQVQPKYSRKAIKARQSGSVKFSYSISAQGEVNNIVIVESNVNRELNYSAKKALSKWRYKANKFNGEGYEIIFDFVINKKK